MAILTTSGRTAIAQSIAAQPIHFAWGTGNASWEATHVAEDLAATGLVSEIGRRLATQIRYVNPDDAGDVIVPVFNDASGNSIIKRFSFSDTPTPDLYMQFNFDFSDAPVSTIREVAIFVGTQVISGLPAGQKYFIPAEIDNQGTLLALENLVEHIQRSPNSRQSFEFVLTI
jgi:hypothetical protein